MQRIEVPGGLPAGRADLGKGSRSGPNPEEGVEPSPLVPVPKPAFLEDIHAFRGIAISFVVAAHVLSAFTWTGETLTVTRRLLMIVLQNSTILFVFIAGYLFHHLSSRFEFGRYLRTKLQNVILPYLVLSIPAIYYFTAVTQRATDIRPGFYENPVGLQVVEFYLTGAHLAPYWFIPMIALYYLAAPLFLWLSSRPTPFLVLIPFVVVSALVPRGGIMTATVHYASVYLAGILASRFRPQVVDFMSRRWVVVTGVAAFAILVWLEVTSSSGAVHYLNYLQKMVLSFLLIGLLYHSWRKLPNWVAAIAGTSFGIYFIHSYLISAEKMVVIQAFGGLPTGSLLRVAVMAVAVTLVCHFAIRLAQHLLGARSRFLVGA